MRIAYVIPLPPRLLTVSQLLYMPLRAHAAARALFCDADGRRETSALWPRARARPWESRGAINGNVYKLTGASLINISLPVQRDTWRSRNLLRDNGALTGAWPSPRHVCRCRPGPAGSPSRRRAAGASTRPASERTRRCEPACDQSKGVRRPYGRPYGRPYRMAFGRAAEGRDSGWAARHP